MNLYVRFLWIFVVFLAMLNFHCHTVQMTEENSSASPLSSSSFSYEILPPPVEGEEILDENGEIVQNHTGEKEFFQKPSTDPKEFFRVYVSGEEYQLRQIRGTSMIRRKADRGGDALICEDMGNYNIINLKDEGIISVMLNSSTGGFELINFDGRVPRINEIAKIIQNDIMRWQIEHEFIDDKPQVTFFRVYYLVELKQILSREEVKERFLKKKKKN